MKIDLQANDKLRESVWIDKERLGGHPCLKGTRYPIHQLVSQIAVYNTLEEITQDFDLDLNQVQLFFEGLGEAIYAQTEIDDPTD
jgi:uncharacterized protein (DUF433 family)